jgi:outer membrane protein OmpA-like peptidoglycan-associated protein
MAKGIKKIEWTGEGKIASNLSIQDKKAVIQADQFVFFKITEWFDGTSDEDKRKNIVWHFQTNNPRESVLKTTKKAEDIYGIKLPKKLCGPFLYYLQVNLSSLEYSRSAGLLIGGVCEPKIVSSAWSTATKGKDVRLTHEFCYGHPLYLHLDTEGLNGYNNLIIEVYRRVKEGKGTKDDQLIKVYTQTPVINGEVNVILNDTISWSLTKKEEVEKFYIKVKNPATKKYIEDYNHDVYHARFLRIKNKTELVLPKIETGNSKAKVKGESKKYEKNPGGCKFTKIGITYNEDYDVIFDEGKFIRRINPNDKFDTLEKIHYDYDKWEIRNDAKPILDKVAIYLKETPLLPVELGAHTDIRGTDEYNMELSAKRADSVVKYLISKDVPANLISAKGYGKTKLINTGDNISEELHQENRRTTLRFKLFENDAQTLVHEVIAPSYKMPAKLSINIEGLIRKGCHKTKEHLNKIIFYNDYKEYESRDLVENKTNKIDTKLYSKIPTIPKIKDSIRFGKEYKNTYHYYLNSCAYYSVADNPVFAITAYPDIVWIGHFQYNYTYTEEKNEKAKEPYYFHDKTLELKNGIEQEITEISNSLFGKIMSLFPNGWLMKEVFLPYVQKQAKFYDIGLHAIYDRKLEKREEELSLKGTELDFIKTDNSARYIAGFIIYEFVAIGIAIDLLMLYFTREGSAESKLTKIANKSKKASKYINDAGAEIVPSSIAINTGMYYKMLSDRRIALIYEANIKADPLVAINFEKKFNIKSLLFDDATKGETDEDKKKRNKKISDKLAKMGKDDVTFTLAIMGEINLEQNLKFNSLTEQYSLQDKFCTLIEKNKIAYTQKIAGSVLFEHAADKKLFEFTPLETKVTTSLTLKLACESIVIIEYGYDKKDNKGLFMTLKLRFSGLKGTFKANVKARVDDDEAEYSPNDGKPIDFTVLEDNTYTLSTIYLFNNTKSHK